MKAFFARGRSGRVHPDGKVKFDLCLLRIGPGAGSIVLGDVPIERGPFALGDAKTQLMAKAQELGVELVDVAIHAWSSEGKGPDAPGRERFTPHAPGR